MSDTKKMIDDILNGSSASDVVNKFNEVSDDGWNNISNNVSLLVRNASTMKSALSKKQIATLDGGLRGVLKACAAILLNMHEDSGDKLYKVVNQIMLKKWT
jgi:hypothetical protein